MTSETDSVLAGHRCKVADFVGGGVGHVASSEDVFQTTDLEVAIDVQATLTVSLGVQLLG
ncbi:hypothetical protein D9M69_519440 [compost metagenome]